MKFSLNVILIFAGILFSFPVLAFDFVSCRFDEAWTQHEEGVYISEIKFDARLFETPSEHSLAQNPFYMRYLETFNATKTPSAEQRLRNALELWRKSEAKVAGGAVKTIEAILSGTVGVIRKSTCIEIALFQAGAQKQNFDFSKLIDREFSGMVWRRGEDVVIVIESGIMTSVTPDRSLQNDLAQKGYDLFLDFHNHPALGQNTDYKGSDFGPNLFPSSSDLGFWNDKFSEVGLKYGVISDGFEVIEFNESQSRYTSNINFCGNYPDYYTCTGRSF